MKEVDLVYRTLYAELAQRGLDASFDATFPQSGNFLKIPVDGREYWYFHDAASTPARRYVGPVSDPEITRRAKEFRQLRDSFKGQRKLVSTLVREAGFPQPERLTGDVVEAFERAGLFRLRGVLVGTVAYQTYAPYLGVKLPNTAMQTGDADFAQFHSISADVGDSLPPILDLLRSVDPTFRPLPHPSGSLQSTRFSNSAGYLVEFLTPNRGSDDYSGKPTPMPALGGASAEPLRFLDFLIHEPVRAMLLHKAGIPVLVPSPERYAIHKMIVSGERHSNAGGLAKRQKDLLQARSLAEALALTRQQTALAEVFVEAWNRGPRWRTALLTGLNFFTDADRLAVRSAIDAGLGELGETPEGY